MFILTSESILHMMTSSNGDIFRVTGHLCGEFTGQRWIPHTKARDAELWCFFLICVWINGWVNNREASDLRRYRAHYDVSVMIIDCSHKRPAMRCMCVFICFDFTWISYRVAYGFRRREVAMMSPKCNTTLSQPAFEVTQSDVLFYVFTHN